MKFENVVSLVSAFAYSEIIKVCGFNRICYQLCDPRKKLKLLNKNDHENDTKTLLFFCYVISITEMSPKHFCDKETIV